MTKTELKKLVGNQFFGATFVKKNGEIRKMLCRVGVKKYLKGGVKKYDYDDLLTVYDLKKKAYRTIPLSRLLTLNAKGKTIEVR